MINERYTLLQDSDSEPFTPEEIAAGWHFCPDWDFLLLNPSMDESHSCGCFTDQQKECQHQGYIVRKKQMQDHWRQESEQLQKLEEQND